MDNFRIPRKVNRHVYKAVFNLTVPGEYVTFEQILEEVRFSIRNRRPSKDLPDLVRRSIRNLKIVGVLLEKDNRFTLFLPSLNKQQKKKVKTEGEGEGDGTGTGTGEDADGSSSKDEDPEAAESLRDLYKSFSEGRLVNRTLFPSEKDSGSRTYRLTAINQYDFYSRAERIRLMEINKERARLFTKAQKKLNDSEDDSKSDEEESGPDEE
ncbi:hypothetical protein KR067_013534 [Drosophila pandora]|nr:hypothetical protein KR067_013534 [Drosophila pandora]